MTTTITADTGAVSGTAGLKQSADSSGVLALATGTGTTAVTIDASQNVGIGATPSVTPTGYKYLSVGAAGNGFYGYNSFGVQLTSNAQLSGSTWQYAYGTGSNTAARIDMNDSAAGFKFFTAAAGTGGSTISWTQAMTLDSSGNLLVGDTSGAFNTRMLVAQPTSSVNALALWNSATTGNNQFVQFFTDGGAGRGSITYNRGGGLTAYNTTSDYRAKTVNGAVEDALSKVAQLNPSTGRMNGAEYDIDFFVAHELQAVVPSAVTGEKDDINEDGSPKYQMVDKSALIPLLTAAIQEQQALIAAMREELDAVKTKVNA